MPNTSWVIFNNKGKLSVSASSGLELGMVTDALWTDYDNDGWEDLLVVREWDSPLFLKNMNGKELVPQVIPELDDLHGIWYSVASGDLDLDGELIDKLKRNLFEVKVIISNNKIFDHLNKLYC
jgi:hypothetical protein